MDGRFHADLGCPQERNCLERAIHAAQEQSIAIRNQLLAKAADGSLQCDPLAALAVLPAPKEDAAAAVVDQHLRRQYTLMHMASQSDKPPDPDVLYLLASQPLLWVDSASMVRCGEYLDCQPCAQADAKGTKADCDAFLSPLDTPGFLHSMPPFLHLATLKSAAKQTSPADAVDTVLNVLKYESRARSALGIPDRSLDLAPLVNLQPATSPAQSARTTDTCAPSDPSSSSPTTLLSSASAAERALQAGSIPNSLTNTEPPPLNAR
eukprot:gene8277-1478_t